MSFGDPITQKIEEGLRKSRVLVPCISSNFANSEWARAEWSAILNAELSRRPAQAIIPLILDVIEPEMPALLRDRRRVSYSNDAEFREFLSFISGTVDRGPR